MVMLKRERVELFPICVGREEYSWHFRDKHDRFLARYSKRRVYECEISEWLFERGLLNIEWPRRAHFAVTLTHDVDYSRMESSYALRSVRKALYQGRFSLASKRLAGIFTKNSILSRILNK